MKHVKVGEPKPRSIKKILDTKWVEEVVVTLRALSYRKKADGYWASTEILQNAANLLVRECVKRVRKGTRHDPR